MARRRRKRLPEAAAEATIESLTPDGRGITHVDGKTVFVDGGLAGERVQFVYTGQRRQYAEGRVTEVLAAAAERVEPPCVYFGTCGGCSLQHLDSEAQVRVKQRSLLDALERIGGLQPEHLLAPLTGPTLGYRRKARLGVRYVPRKGRVLVGFRERRSHLLADIDACRVLSPPVGDLLVPLAGAIGAMTACRSVPQIEVAVGDNAATLVFRHLVALSETDRDRLKAFGEEHGVQIGLQPGGPETSHALWPAAQSLYFDHPAFGIRLHFQAHDFVQVNADVNRRMVLQACDLLDPQPQDRILDLFCGLGNFSLPLARRSGSVTGVEGDAAMVARARDNARCNGITNAQFHTADLGQPAEASAAWAGTAYDKAVLDPPRSGAREVLPAVVETGVRRVLYVSCHPGTLARDAGDLVHRYGYRLVQVGVMDMFPHTAHVECMALFER